VMIISESTAREFFGSASPIAKAINLDRPHLQNGNKLDRYEVVGMTKDVKYAHVDEEPHKTGYLPLAQDSEPGPEILFEIRSDILTPLLTTGVQKAIGAVAPEVSISFRSFETQVSDSL